MKRLLVLLVLATMMVPPAFAHPFTDSTVPEQFSSAPKGTSEVIMYYSEAIEVDFSALKVYDSAGNQIDNRDTRYHSGENSLVVTTPPLDDGVYTVTSKVLSKVDGHLVDYAFVFGVGDAAVPDEFEQAETELIFFPEAGARFPGLVGQTIVLGSAIAALFVWRSREGLEAVFHFRFTTMIGIGLVMVFASNILMLAVQILRLEAPVLDVLQTASGTTWIYRMLVTIALLGVWFAIERKKLVTTSRLIPLLALSLVLISSTTMMGHGAASEQASAIALDYIHNLVSSVWIGGVIFFAFVLLPALGRLGDKPAEKAALAVIPRFSVMFIAAIGLVIVSGPLLLWLLESDLTSITDSTYGRLIFVKIAIAAGMVGIGGYHQFVVQRGGEIGRRVRGKLRRALRIESGLGIALLAVVAVLTNGTLPAGEVQVAESADMPVGVFTEFSENFRFDIGVEPFATGTNLIAVSVSGAALDDLQDVKVKVSNPQRSISPIVIPVERTGDVFAGQATFGFSGYWQIEAEAQRVTGANEAVIITPLIKPQLDDISAQITEYDLPEPSAPLYPLYDGHGSIWVSDASAPRVWRFDIDAESFTKYEYDGETSITLAQDHDGRIWFTDVPGGQIGSIEPGSGATDLLELPTLRPLVQDSLPISVAVDADNDIWTTVTNKNVLLRYNQDTQEFDVFELPTPDSAPFAVASGPDRNMWFTQQGTGYIGYIDIDTGAITEIVPPEKLATPETITFDGSGGMWISEHAEGGAITRYDTILETFRRVQAPDPAAFPNSAVLDHFENVWFVQHTVDKLGVYDPHRDQLREIPVPTENSWVQFATSDDSGNIWFAEQRPNKLATVKLSALPVSAPDSAPEAPAALRYSEVAGPLIAAGIVAASLFFVKGVRDMRRLESAGYDDGQNGDD